MPQITWSFNSGFQDWTTRDDSVGAGASSVITAPGGRLEQSVAIDAIPSIASGFAISPQWLTDQAAPLVNGDTVEMDVDDAVWSIPGDLSTTHKILVFYTDLTSTGISSTDPLARTMTLTIPAAKTLDRIEVEAAEVGNGGGGGPAEALKRNVLEVRLTTATAIEPTPGILRTPQAFIEDQGAGAAGGAGGGSGGNLAAISADGLNIYIAAFNDFGFPTLIRMSALLTSDGTVVFDPADGDRIGVQTGEQNAGTVWIAGGFGGTDTVEKSEDSGASFTVKDDGSFGTVRTFQVGPSDDDRVLVFDGDNGDILETLNDGETWSTINAAVTPLMNSIARFSLDLQEIAAGNQGGVSDSINYSPNSGANLEDYQTGVYPNADATKIRVT
jgi:hypothetical protein